MRKVHCDLFSPRIVGVLILASLLVIGAGFGNTVRSQQENQITVEVRITNQNCRGGVQVSQLVFSRGVIPLAFKVITPPQQIEIGSSRTFSHELSAEPSTVLIKGTINEQQPLNVNASSNTTEYECGLIRINIFGQESPEPEPQPQPEEPERPSQLQGISQGMSPQQVLNRVRSNGFNVQELGSRSNPKLGDVSDPLITGALGPGFLTGTAYWVSGPGQLRSAVLWDQPGTMMVLLVVSNFGNLCWSVPPPGGGTAVFCDRPAAFSPATTFGGGPVPGNLFLVVVLKIGGSTQPYILSLSG